MFNKQRYIDGDRVKSELIALDIRYRKISHDDIMSLISDPQISAAFYGEVYKDKVPESRWDEDYLEELSYAVISEGFNEDYLLYLEKVANTVAARKNHQKLVVGGVVLAVAVVAVVAVVASIA